MKKVIYHLAQAVDATEATFTPIEYIDALKRLVKALYQSEEDSNSHS